MKIITTAVYLWLFTFNGLGAPMIIISFIFAAAQNNCRFSFRAFLFLLPLHLFFFNLFWTETRHKEKEERKIIGPKSKRKESQQTTS